ncbi:hypothetical protein LL251_17060 [Sphingobium naphthae]|nr:hypothetical protein [Sphingobium naphthae]
MIKRLSAIALLSALVACASYDRTMLAAESGFEPTDEGFVFKTKAYTDMQEDSSGAEANRIKIMDDFARRNSVCPSGYNIDRREVIRRPKTALGISTLADIHYHASCK